MGINDHITGTIGDFVVGVGRAVVKELVDADGSGFYVSGLLGADFAEGMKEFVVDGTGILDDNANNTLDILDSGVV